MITNPASAVTIAAASAIEVTSLGLSREGSGNLMASIGSGGKIGTLTTSALRGGGTVGRGRGTRIAEGRLGNRGKLQRLEGLAGNSVMSSKRRDDACANENVCIRAEFEVSSWSWLSRDFKRPLRPTNSEGEASEDESFLRS